MINTTQERKSEGTESNVEIKQKPVATLLLPVLSWNNRKSPKNYHLQRPQNTTMNEHLQYWDWYHFFQRNPKSVGEAGDSQMLLYTVLVLHSVGDIWISFYAAVSRGPSQMSGCSFGTLQRHGAGATSKLTRLHSPRGWFQPNAENYVMFAKILMRVMLQC